MGKFFCLLWQRIRAAVKSSPLVFAVFMAVQIVTASSYIFFYSTVVKSRADYIGSYESMRTLTAALPDGDYNASIIGKILKNDVAKPDQVVFYFAATAEKKPKVVCAYLYSANKGKVVSGRSLTDNDVKNKAMYIIPANNTKEFEPNPNYHEVHSLGDTVMLAGLKFTAIGLRYNGDYDEVPISTAFEHFRLTGFDFLTPQGLTDTEKKEIGDYFSAELNASSVKLPKPMAQKIMANLFFPLAASAFTGVIAILNFIFLYRYMIERCRGDYTILRICGCSRIKALFVLFSQFLLLFTAAYAMSVLTILALKLFNVQIFKTASLSFSGCIAILITFIALIIIMMLPVGVRFFRKSIADEEMRLP